MAYFYVKNSLGTRTTGGGTTKQTGTFTALGAANVYATIQLAITDGASSGDFICVSDAHSYSSAAIDHDGPTSGDYLNIVSVADANCDTYAAASSAQETYTGTGFLYHTGRIADYGMYYKTSYLIRLDAYTMIKAQGCTWEAVASGDFWIYCGGDGVMLYASDSTFIGVSGSLMRAWSGVDIRIYGGSFSGITDLFNSSTGQVGGATAKLVGVDLSSISGYLLQDGGSAPATDGAMNIHYIGCKLNATTSFANETFENYHQRLRVENSSSTSAGAEYQFHVTAYGGSADDDTAIYRDGMTAFPSTQKISLKCVTDANAQPAAPFWLDFPIRYAALSDTASDTLSIYILSSATLYDSDVWAEMVYPDGTTKQLYNYISTRHTNVLDTNGTELGTNTEAWTGRTAENRYQIDIDTSGDAGADSVPTIRLFIAKASATIYFCPTLGLS